MKRDENKPKHCFIHLSSVLVDSYIACITMTQVPEESIFQNSSEVLVEILFDSNLEQRIGQVLFYPNHSPIPGVE